MTSINQDATVTIVVSPRERYSHALASLESIYANTTVPFDLIYIDGNSPPSIRNALAKQAAVRGLKLLRVNHFLRPNQARNLSLPHVNSRYVVFLDNDLEVQPGWLEALVKCAEDTQAAVVGPLYLEGKPEHQIVHMYGGRAQFRGEPGQRRFIQSHRFLRHHLSDIAPQLKREETELIEFHCVLVRTEILKALGPFDEGYPSLLEHADFALTVRQSGGAVYVEPASIVAYVTPQVLSLSDLRFFLWRWSNAANLTSVQYFCQKWQVDFNSGFAQGQLIWGRRHRLHMLVPQNLQKTYRTLKARLKKMVQLPMRNILTQKART
jgi:GT2 family glycosyltransferase